MVILVGPETVSFSCVGSSCSGRTDVGNSRVRVVRPYGEKGVRCLAGLGRRRIANVRLQVKLNGGLWNSRRSTPLRRAVRSQGEDLEDTSEASTSESASSKEKDMMNGWGVKAAEAASALLVFGPGVDMANKSVEFSQNTAMASLNSVTSGLAQKTFDCFAKMRPGTMLLDKVVGGFRSGKFIDKVVTVVSGPFVVNPDDLEKEVKEILEKPQSFEEWRNGFLDNFTDGIGTAFDVITHLTPEGVKDSVSTSFSSVFEVGAERFAAFEISSLVGLTERWLIYIPLVVLPMAWQMRARSAAAAADSKDREVRRLVISEKTDAKAERVRRELERIRLKASLLEIIKSTGEVALQRMENGRKPKNSEITTIVDQLKVMNPGYEVKLNSRDPGSTMRSGSGNDAFSDTPSAPQLDGNWNLVYVSQSLQNRDLPQVPGVEIHNPRQQVWNQGSNSAPSLDADILGSSLFMAKNVAELRLGPLGLLEVGFQGSWENLRNGQAGLVSFDTFLIRPKEILGAYFGDDLPSVSVALPQALQSTAEWDVLYLDETLRINRGQQDDLFIFTRNS